MALGRKSIASGDASQFRADFCFEHSPDKPFMEF